MEEQRKNIGFRLTSDPGGDEPRSDSPVQPVPGLIGRKLTEPGRFAYAGLCGVSLGQLFPGPENRSFRELFLEGLVCWLGLDESVRPVMGAFLAGLGFEGSDTFLSILHAEPLLSAGALPITQDLVSFSIKDGQYDARSRVLIRHVGCLLRVSPEQLEEFEATLGERLREGVEESEEESTRRRKKERGRKLRRYLLIGLATVGGGTVIGSFQAPWCSLGPCGEQYCLVWESRFLRDLGATMTTLLDGLVSMVAQEALKYTVLSGIVTALTWPASVLAVASVIDNPWSVCLSRSAEVGKHLAQVLRSRQQGRRPVSLIGFSLGARVLYFCLQELANDQGNEGMVEDVVLLGAPVDGSEKSWERLTNVVAGRIVNGYCRGDWLLGFLYRSSAAQLSVAGLQPINVNDRRIINVDLSSVVNGHLDYMRQMDTILVAVGVPTREAPGAAGPLFKSLSIREGAVDSPDSIPTDSAEKPDPKGAQHEAEEEGIREESEMKEREEPSDGWDIPDISDLLESMKDGEVASGEGILCDLLSCPREAEEDRGQASCPREAEEDRGQALCPQEAEEDRGQALCPREAEEDRGQASCPREAEEDRGQASCPQEAEEDSGQASCTQEAEEDRGQASWSWTETPWPSEPTCGGSKRSQTPMRKTLKDGPSHGNLPNQNDSTETQEIV